MTYEFRKSHPVLRWLPTKLAQWVSTNISNDLQIPDKNEDKWTAAELNSFPLNNAVCGPHGHLCTFCLIEWQCGLFNGRPTARCYSFNTNSYRFRDKNPQVSRLKSNTISNKILYMIGHIIWYSICHTVTIYSHTLVHYICTLIFPCKTQHLCCFLDIYLISLRCAWQPVRLFRLVVELPVGGERSLVRF
jgi:hypothetical protein